MKPVILSGPVLKERTTLRLGGQALAEVRLDDMHAFDGLPRVLERLGGTPAVLGRGSNILARDGELPLVIINPALKAEPEAWADPQAEDRVLVRVAAGVRLPVLLGRLAAQGLSGLEGLAGVPGTVGGAVAMNAGSYGNDMGSVLSSVEIFSAGTGMIRVPRSQCRCEYRHFSVPAAGGWFVVAAVTLQLRRSTATAVRDAMRSNVLLKKKTQPVTEHSAGCVFKNPADGISAGRLLDQCGFRGRGKGGMAFSSLHANFLVNKAQGTSDDAMDLINDARHAVERATGHYLELEVKIWPWQ
ncbi:UDP-N-acetylmuramate dehydrogenase [Oleidesulfovibrio alaskensis]